MSTGIQVSAVLCLSLKSTLTHAPHLCRACFKLARPAPQRSD